MTKIRGFKIGKRLICFSRWIFRRKQNPSGYGRLIQSESAYNSRIISGLINWGRRLRTGAAKTLWLSNHCRSGYIPMGQEPPHEKPKPVPKGHLAVYVGQKDGDFHRVLVPVIYFNHPLFGELLRDAENEYGFNQQGGLTIPCRFSEFEKVQTRIESGSRGRKMTRKRNLC